MNREKWGKRHIFVNRFHEMQNLLKFTFGTWATNESRNDVFRDTPSTYDTFVRVYLLPAASPDEEPPLQKTKTQKKSAMPTFDETFTFKVSLYS